MQKRILIVDDSASVRGLIRATFQSRPDYEVCGEAADGVEGIQKGRQLKPDLIILDLSMPRMNGLKAASFLRIIAPNLPIILFTNYKDVISIALALDFGVTSVVSKTDKLGTLVDEVKRLTT